MTGSRRRRTQVAPLHHVELGKTQALQMEALCTDMSVCRVQAVHYFNLMSPLVGSGIKHMLMVRRPSPWRTNSAVVAASELRVYARS